MNAGMSASRKTMSNTPSQSKVQAPKEDRNPGEQKEMNLDNESSSQMTYPNQYSKSFLPKEQANRVEQQFEEENNSQINLNNQKKSHLNKNSQYDGIYYNQGGFSERPEN